MAEKKFRCLKCDETDVKFYKDLIPYCDAHFPKPKDKESVKEDVAQILAAKAPEPLITKDAASAAIAMLTAPPVEVPKEKAKAKPEVTPTVKAEGKKKAKEAAPAAPAADTKATKAPKDWVVCAKDGEVLFSGGKTKKDAQEWAQSQIAIKKLRIGQYKVAKVE